MMLEMIQGRGVYQVWPVRYRVIAALTLVCVLAGTTWLTLSILDHRSSAKRDTRVVSAIVAHPLDNH
jgi:hypothetical protein